MPQVPRPLRRLATAALTSFALFVAGPGAPGLTAQEAEDVFRIERLADGVYAAIVVPQPDAYAFANSLVLVGELGVLVVDTQQSPRAARALIREIEALTDLPVRWVVNTHWHGDHVYGNSAYRDRWPGVEVIATPGTFAGMRGPGIEMRLEELASLPETIAERERWLETGSLPGGQALDEDLREQVEYSLRMRRVYLAELRALEMVYPTTLLDNRMSLDMGGRSVTLISVGRAHTDGDLAVFLEDDRILAVGDLVEEGVPWLEGADLGGWASALEALQALAPLVILPAHAQGPMGRAVLDGEAALIGDLAREPLTATSGENRVAQVIARLETHRAFLAQLGVTSDTFDRWATEAARLATGATR